MASGLPPSIKLCPICGDTARYVNYGALTCASCKVFFRRRGFHRQTYTCVADGCCRVTMANRRFCVACRFAKCLAAGMIVNLIRKEDVRRKKSLLAMIESNQSHSLLPTLDLLRNDRSTLATSHWTLLSNVAHAFDRFSPIAEARQLIERMSVWPMHLDFDISPVLSLFTQFYTSTESFVSCSADFQTLTLAEKQSLYGRNLHGVLNLFATFVFYTAGMFAGSANERILASVYDVHTYQRTKRISSQLEFDPTVVKLMLFILAFSSNCYMVDMHENTQRDALMLGTFRLLGSQNRYIEILWRYMLYRYEYMEAAKRLLTLVKSVLDLLAMSSEVHQTNKIHQDFVEEVTVLAEESLTQHENDVVVLWGKS